MPYGIAESVAGVVPAAAPSGPAVMRSMFFLPCRPVMLPGTAAFSRPAAVLLAMAPCVRLLILLPWFFGQPDPSAVLLDRKPPMQAYVDARSGPMRLVFRAGAPCHLLLFWFFCTCRFQISPSFLVVILLWYPCLLFINARRCGWNAVCLDSICLVFPDSGCLIMLQGKYGYTEGMHKACFAPAACLVTALFIRLGRGTRLCPARPGCRPRKGRTVPMPAASRPTGGAHAGP